MRLKKVEALLRPVVITPYTDCVTYAFLRSGVSDFITGTVCYVDMLQRIATELNYVEEDLRVADLLMWSHRSRERDLPLCIDSAGLITPRKDLLDFHLAVYEGRGMFSDATWNDPEKEDYRIIKLRKLKEVTPPSKIFRSKIVPLRYKEDDRG